MSKASRLDELYRLFCGISGENNFAGTRFSCALPRGHEGKHQFRSLQETMSTIERLVELGFVISIADVVGEKE